MRSVLLVEDDSDIVELLSHYFAKEGWAVEASADGREALLKARNGRPDLVVLDIQLPGIDGLELCRRLRGDPATRHVPIVMLTARGDETDRIVGLELGADDYVTKPFSPKELIARVRALFRRLDRPPEQAATLRFGLLEIDRSRHVASWGARPVPLAPKEFALLVALLEAGGRVLTRRRLLEEVWGYSYSEGTRTVDVHVRRLREKLPELAQSLITVKSVGYRLAAERSE